jgi:DNA-binding NarL/FixJ family response regulator
MAPERRVRVAAVNDYEVVVEGLAAMLRRHEDRLDVRAAIIVGSPIAEPVDVALYDTYGRQGIASSALRTLVNTPEVDRVALFSIDLHPDLITEGRLAGASGFISKALTGDQIADAIVRIAAGEQVVAATPDAPHDPRPEELAWPGRSEGLTERESEVLVLLAEGLSNREIATALYLSPETIKSYLRPIYAKLDVRNRVEATAYVHRSGAFQHQRRDPGERRDT